MAHIINLHSPTLQRMTGMGLVLPLIVCIASMTTYAQGPTSCPAFTDPSIKVSNELGINMMALVHFKYDPLYPRPLSPRLSLVNGINYKRRIGKNAYRASVDHFRDRFEVNRGHPDYAGYYAAVGNATRSEIRLGFEHRFFATKITPYAAIDLEASLERVRLTGEALGDIAWGPFVTPYDYDISSRSIGADLVIGIASRLSKHFSLSVESSASFTIWSRSQMHGSINVRSTHPKVILDTIRSFSLHYHF